MKAQHKPLPNIALESGTGFRQPPYVAPEEVLNLPALDFMTDFKAVTPITVGPDVAIDTALEKMRVEGVRLLLVTDSNDRIIGKITTKEIMGEKPIEIVREQRVSRSEIRVKDIMTPQSKVKVLDYRSLHKTQIGHIVATLNHLKLKHLLVVEFDTESKAQVLRGVFSRSKISKDLHIDLKQVETQADSLAEIVQRKR